MKNYFFHNNICDVRKKKSILKNISLEEFIQLSSTKIFLIDLFPEKIADFEKLEQEEIFYTSEAEDNDRFFKYTENVISSLGEILGNDLIIAVYWNDFNLSELNDRHFFTEYIKSRGQREVFEVYAINSLSDSFFQEIVKMSLAGFVPVHILDDYNDVFLFINDNEIVMYVEDESKASKMKHIVESHNLYLRRLC